MTTKQPPAPAKSGYVRRWSDEKSAYVYVKLDEPPAPAEGAPDVAWLVKIILASLYIGTDGASIFGAHKAARVIFTAQAVALAAKEAEIERLRSDAPGTPNARLKWIGDWAVSHGLCLGVEAQAPEKFVIEHIAALEAALQKIIDLQDRSFVGGESLIMRAITIARAALSGKEPQQP